MRIWLLIYYGLGIYFYSSLKELTFKVLITTAAENILNPCPAEPGYILPLQTV